MAILADLQVWLDLQTETLARVHASWLPQIPAQLVVEARKRTLGRRWLARRLADVSPLFSGPPQQSEVEAAGALRRGLWLAPLLRDAVECALDLGSLVLADTIRTAVARAAVMKLRTTLGPARYSRAVQAAASNSSAAAQKTTRLSSNDGDEILAEIRRCGAVELAGLAEHLHPAWGESVRLTFERMWWDDAPAPRLTPELAESSLRQRSPTDVVAAEK